MGVVVHAANVQDKVGARWLLRRIPFVTRWQKFLFDGGYNSDSLLSWCRQQFGVAAEIVKRSDQPGFTVLPKRWVVERSLGWLNRFRRLSKDYEQVPQVSESFVYVSMIQLMLRRLCR